MTFSTPPMIFWITLGAVPALLLVAIAIGRACTILLPSRLQGPARYYLAPALGLASLTVMATLFGRYMPLGHRALLPLVFASLAAWALVRRHEFGLVVRQSLWSGAFALACGAGMLAPLLVYGAFNTDNDTFTYLAHAQWLQQHPFSQSVLPETVTPFETQILLYQQAGFRMGGSYLLALLQSLLHLGWAYAAYPALLIAAVASCCLSLGFPLARQLRLMRRSQRLMLLALPAFGLGGLTFGANFGFMPQTLGMALAAGALFMAGPVLGWVTHAGRRAPALATAALPGGVMLAGATLAFSELSLFIGCALAASGLLLALQRRAWNNVLLHGAVMLAVATLLLNVELLRVYAALRAQVGVVAGAPVDWSLIGFVAHAFGVHGGAWDAFQWAGTGTRASAFAGGLLLLALVLAPIAFNWRALWRAAIGEALLPALAVLGIFGVATLYFRYAVAAPFPTGIGQSWSQSKLAGWAYPFAIVMTVFSIACLRRRFPRHVGAALVLLFVAGGVGTIALSITRVSHFMQPYAGIRDMERFYLELRAAALAICPPAAPVHLALNGNLSKFRQMTALYLHDRALTSDWRDDNYLDWIPASRRNQSPAAGSCLVGLASAHSLAPGARVVGPFQVAPAQPGTPMLGAVSGAHQRETDGQNWWSWVEGPARFAIEPGATPLVQGKIRVRFEYLTRGRQVLTLRVVRRDGSFQQIELPETGEAIAAFDQLVDTAPGVVAELAFSTDGKASILGPADPRLGAWLIRNITLAEVPP
jgi:hypothetical protein